MLVSSGEMLRGAQRHGYAVGAFNVENAEMLTAVIDAAGELSSPVIIQTSASTLKYLAPHMFAAMARAAAQGTRIPIALHLDHGNDLALVNDCINSGYTSVMIDGSALPYSQNIGITGKACELAHSHGVPVEAELGFVGGKSTDPVSTGKDQYTDPDQAADFIQRTGADSLAISIGTKHGHYTDAPVLDLNRVTLIQGRVDVPLVLHGSSGLSDEVIRTAIKLGISKLNFATELRDAYTQAVREYLAANPKAFDPKKYGEAARGQVKQLVKQKILVCMSDGKA